MANLLAVVSLSKISGVPDDTVQNTFAITTPSTPASAGDLTLVQADLVAFYNAFQATTFAVGNYLSPSISRAAGASLTQIYDVTAHLNGSAHGSPVISYPWQLGPTTTDAPLPDEVAICLTMHSAYGTDPEFGVGTRPRSRDRGRIYLGPLKATTVVNTTTTHEPTADTTMIDTIKDAAHTLLAQTATDGLTWCVWSRTAAAFKPIVGGWVDNAFDTQRRRGNKATLRTTWT